MQNGAWYKTIKTDGCGDFHCFLCECDITGTDNAASHAVGIRHKTACQLFGLILPLEVCPDVLCDDLEENYLSVDDINAVIGYRVNIYEVDDDDGEIYCQKCRSHVRINDIKRHTSKYHSFKMKSANETCGDWYKHIRTDGVYFYCILCKVKAGNEINAVQHAMGSVHAKACNQSDIIVPQGLDFLMLKRKLKSNLVTIGDLHVMLNGRASDFKIANDGTVKCKICECVVNITDVKDHHVKNKKHLAARRSDQCASTSSSDNVWCKRIKTDGYEFRCFLCSCFISGVENAESHAKGRNHSANCESAGINMPPNVQCYKLWDFLHGNYITIEDVRTLIGGNDAKCYSVNSEGEIFCEQCKEDVYMIDLGDHNISADHRSKTAVTRDWYKRVKTDGTSFFCFLCRCKLTTVNHAEQHVKGKLHKSACTKINIIVPDGGAAENNSVLLQDRLRSNFVTVDDLKMIITDEEVSNLGIRIDGSIFCIVCQCTVNIIDVKCHIKSWDHKEKMKNGNSTVKKATGDNIKIGSAKIDVDNIKVGSDNVKVGSDNVKISSDNVKVSSSSSSDDSAGEIFSEQCKENVNTIDLGCHINSADHGSKTTVPRDWYKCVKTDGTSFFCFLCRCKLIAVNHAEEHVKGKLHKLACKKINIIVPDGGAAENISVLLQDRLQSNFVTIDDLKMIISDEEVSNLGIRIDGSIFCIVCQCTVNIIDVEHHLKRCYHKEKIKNGNNTIKKATGDNINIDVDGIKVGSDNVKVSSSSSSDDVKIGSDNEEFGSDNAKVDSDSAKVGSDNVNIDDDDSITVDDDHGDWWYSDVKTDGLYFYCFLCQCDISGVENAVQHAKGTSHATVCGTRGIRLPDNVDGVPLTCKLKSNALTVDDIGLYTGYAGRFYTIDSAGKIYCTKCQDHTGIGNLNGHLKSLAHKDLTMNTRETTADWYMYVRTDGSSSGFYCFLCYSNINGIDQAEIHVKSNAHISACKLLGIVTPSDVEKIPIRGGLASNYVRRNELVFILGSRVQNFTIAVNGRIGCNVCNRPVVITDVKNHNCFRRSASIESLVLFDRVKTDGKLFYCFLCLREISGVENAEQHVKSALHIKNCSSSSSSSANVNDDDDVTKIVNLRSQLLANFVTIEDVNLHLGYTTNCYTINNTNNSTGGGIHCEICACYVNMAEIKHHENSSVHRSNYISNAINNNRTLRSTEQNEWWYERYVKTDGRSFYCFLCKSNLENIGNAQGHAVGRRHIDKCKARNIAVPSSFDNISLVRKLELNFVTTDDLARILKGDDASQFEITDGRIYCKICRQHILMSTYCYHSRTVEHRKLGRELSHAAAANNNNNNSDDDDWYYKQIKTDGSSFYCFACDCHLSELDEAELHANDAGHISDCCNSSSSSSSSLINQRSSNHVSSGIDLRFKLKSNFITIDDVSLIAGEAIAVTFYKVEVTTGKILCKVCDFSVSLDSLNSHTMDYHFF